MRSKSYLLGFICIVATSLLLILFGDQRPAVQSILTETHKQLKNNIQTFKVSSIILCELGFLLNYEIRHSPIDDSKCISLLYILD